MKNNLIAHNTIMNCAFGVTVGDHPSGPLIGTRGNIIKKNNFINNEHNANFDTALFTRWRNNYWDDHVGLLPYQIVGTLTLVRGEYEPPIVFTMVNFDWCPAREPFEIP